jgi:drug/metabolite transporter (DMT)-like permease
LNIYLVIFITLFAALLASVAQIMYKRGLANRINGIRSAISAIKNRRVIGGAVIYFTSLAIYLYALSNAPLSVVYPIFASTFIFIAIFSVVMLKEKVTGARALGTFLVFLGVAIIAISIG